MTCFFVCNVFLLYASCNQELSSHQGRIQTKNSKGRMLHFAHDVKKHDHGSRPQRISKLKPSQEEDSDDDCSLTDQAAFLIPEKNQKSTSSYHREKYQPKNIHIARLVAHQLQAEAIAIINYNREQQALARLYPFVQALKITQAQKDVK